MNKKISFPIAIIIILACAILVGGLAVWCYLCTSKVEIPEFKPAEKTPPVAETADWKTYRNEKYDFEFKYPEDWTVIELVSPEHPILASAIIGYQKTIQEGGFFEVSVRYQTEDEYNWSLEREGFYIISKADTTIDGEKATIYTFGRNDIGSSGIQWKDVIIDRGGLLIIFSGGAISTYKDTVKNIFNQILSTLNIERNLPTIISPQEISFSCLSETEIPKELKEISDKEQKLLLDAWEYRICALDLDENKSTQEYMIGFSERASNSEALIYQFQNGQWKMILDDGGVKILVEKEKSNGYYNILSFSHSSASMMYVRRYKFDSSLNSYVNDEGWESYWSDENLKKVNWGESIFGDFLFR